VPVLIQSRQKCPQNNKSRWRIETTELELEEIRNRYCEDVCIQFWQFRTMMLENRCSDRGDDLMTSKRLTLLDDGGWVMPFDLSVLDDARHYEGICECRS
jgi:hypothetical protein